MMVVGAVPCLRGCLVIISQILGGIAASGIVACLLPGPLNVRTSLGRRNICGARTIHRGTFLDPQTLTQLPTLTFLLLDVPNRATRIHHLHASGRKAPRNLHCARRHRPVALHRRAHGRVLHGRQPEPGAVVRALRHPALVPPLPLDLLGRAHTRIAAGEWVLHVHQGGGV